VEMDNEKDETKNPVSPTEATYVLLDLVNSLHRLDILGGVIPRILGGCTLRVENERRT
jgi:hypothetical protein